MRKNKKHQPVREMRRFLTKKVFAQQQKKRTLIKEANKTNFKFYFNFEMRAQKKKIRKFCSHDLISEVRFYGE